MAFSASAGSSSGSRRMGERPLPARDFRVCADHRGRSPIRRAGRCVRDSDWPWSRPTNHPQTRPSGYSRSCCGDAPTMAHGCCSAEVMSRAQSGERSEPTLDVTEHCATIQRRSRGKVCFMSVRALPAVADPMSMLGKCSDASRLRSLRSPLRGLDASSALPCLPAIGSATSLTSGAEGVLCLCNT